jgi:hypothetical protein
VYKKKNDPDTWIEAVKGASGYRWYLKPVANKGPTSSVCFAYVAIDVDNLSLPLDIDTPWTVNTANGFAEQKNIVLLKASDKPTPFLLEELVTSAQVKMNEQNAEAKAEVCIILYYILFFYTVLNYKSFVLIFFYFLFYY